MFWFKLFQSELTMFNGSGVKILSPGPDSPNLILYSQNWLFLQIVELDNALENFERIGQFHHGRDSPTESSLWLSRMGLDMACNSWTEHCGVK